MNLDVLNLNVLSDEALIQNTEKPVQQERELLIKVLHHLREIDRRRLFSALGYKSLFDFAVKRLGYPEDQAYRRISAMRLLKQVPEVEQKIAAGEISITHLSLAQTLFRQEKKIANEFSGAQKLEVLQKISNQPVREAERILLAQSSAPAVARDRTRVVADDHVEYKFTARHGVTVKVERLKGYLAHKKPNISMGELFEELCDLGLATYERSAAPRKPCVRTSQAQIKRGVFKKAGNQCESCGSTFALEIEHRVPQAKGGSSEAENLRLFCLSCNQRAAIEQFGQTKMDQFIN